MKKKTVNNQNKPEVKPYVEPNIVKQDLPTEMSKAKTEVPVSVKRVFKYKVINGVPVAVYE